MEIIHISAIPEAQTEIRQNQLIRRKIQAQQKEKQQIIADNKFLIQLVEKYSENIQVISYLMKEKNHYNCMRRIKNLFFRAMVFVEKDIYQRYSKNYGIQYRKLESITMSLVKKNNDFQLEKLKRKLIKILRHMYFNQEINQNDIKAAFQGLRTITNQNQQAPISYKKSKKQEENKSNRLETKNKQFTNDQKQKQEKGKDEPQPINTVEELKEEKSNLEPQVQQQHKPKRVRIARKKVKRQQYDYKKQEQTEKSHKPGRKTILDLWTREQEMKLNQLYQRTNDTLLVPLAAQMLNIYKDNQKFAEEKVKSKFKSLFRKGLLRLQELASMLFGVQVIYPYKIYYKLAGKMLNTRSKLITHEMKKTIMNVNFTDNISRSELTTVLDGVMQYLKKQRQIREQQ